MSIVTCYSLCFAISFTSIFWAARILYRGGKLFLLDVFRGNVQLASSVNRLFVFAFCLLSLGYTLLPLRPYGDLGTARAALELVADKVGFLLVFLGCSQFLSLFLFSRMSRSRAGISPALGPSTLPQP